MSTGAGAVALSTGSVAIGGIATAIGAIGMFWGGAIANRGDAAAIGRKLDCFMARLDGLHREESLPRAADLTDNLKKIEEDFGAWAIEFAENHHFRRLQFTQAKLGREAIAAEMTAKWRPLLRRVFESLNNAIAAYNERVGCGIKADLPDIPDDLFANQYRGSITFDANTFWRLQTETTNPPRPSSRLTLWMYFEKGARSMSSAVASIMIDMQANEFEMFAHGAAVPVDIDLAGTPLAKFDERVSQVIRQLLETQLVDLADE